MNLIKQNGKVVGLLCCDINNIFNIYDTRFNLLGFAEEKGENHFKYYSKKLKCFSEMYSPLDIEYFFGDGAYIVSKFEL